MVKNIIRKCFFAFFSIALISFTAANTAVYAQEYEDDYLKSLEWLDKFEHPIVVELYTSSDCESCGLADTILYELSKHEKVIALGCHIHGSEEPYDFEHAGEEECTHRQMYFSDSRWTGNLDLYTPQFITNGNLKFHALNSHKVYSKMRISYVHTRPPEWAHMNITEDGQTMLIDLPGGDHLLFNDGRSYVVSLVRYIRSKKVITPRRNRENDPRIVRYTNVVKKIRPVGKWYGEEKTIKADLSVFEEDMVKEPGGWVVLVQRRNNDDIVAAGKLPDPPRGMR